MWWCTFFISAPTRQRQEDLGTFWASLVYRMRLLSKKLKLKINYLGPFGYYVQAHGLLTVP